ncbi:hypothetical protein [Pseudostreptobacillus hongkongensis]|uniref:hypothetical protein n=1 Tax=Pseudostreptobacillus hongkongensis TaxID=1162717 RepID=UPI0008333F6D|nr:hypothetical protein [Pseudostreptobacillus hongkongensis]
MYKLPEYYKGVLEFDYLQNNLQLNENSFLGLINELRDELFIIKSKNSGLKIWSNTLECSEDTTEILTKLRGARTITKINLALIVKDILKQDTPVEVTEFNNQYKVFLGVHSVVNTDRVQELLRKELKNIIPSHIELYIYFNVLIWEKFDNYNKNWDIWDNLNLTWEKFEKYNEG